MADATRFTHTDALTHIDHTLADSDVLVFARQHCARCGQPGQKTSLCYLCSESILHPTNAKYTTTTHESDYAPPDF